MAYYNRPELLRRTLQAYVDQHLGAPGVEFVILDDGSDQELRAWTVLDKFPSLVIKHHYFPRKKLTGNPAVPINESVAYASGDIIVITNPECMPLTPVLEQLPEMGPRDYWVAPCYSEPADHHPTFAARSLRYDGDDAWYEHPAIIPRYLYFWAAMRRESFLEIGGIDEEFSDGLGYEDTDFIRRLREAGFNMRHIPDALVLHQNHYSSAATGPEIAELRERNRLLYEKKAAA